MRFDFVNERTSENLKIFVLNHIEAGTHITHEGWSGYNFLNDHNEPIWTHEAHMHGGGDFGYGNSSTSYIEHTWVNLKQIIKNIYGNVQNKNWIYYFRDAIFRLNCKKNDKDKLKIFANILKAVYDLHSFDLYSYEELISFENYDE